MLRYSRTTLAPACYRIWLDKPPTEFSPALVPLPYAIVLEEGYATGVVDRVRRTGRRYQRHSRHEVHWV
jgi:hypothetical protein